MMSEVAAPPPATGPHYTYRSDSHLDCPNYSDIVREILGDTGASVSMVSILIAMYGSNIA